MEARTPYLFLALLASLAPPELLACPFQQALLPLTHMDGVDGGIGGYLVDRLAAPDSLHGVYDLIHGSVGTTFTHLVGAPIRVGTPPHVLTMVPLQKDQDNSSWSGSSSMDSLRFKA